MIPPARTASPAPSSARPRQIDVTNLIGITGVHALACLAFLPGLFSWTGVVLAGLGMYVFGTLGINVFYHRYLTHRSFRCPVWLERTLAVLAICAFQETPAKWVATHRRHHEHSDDEFDPHTPVRGFLWAHVGWLLMKSPQISRLELYGRYAKDVLRDPFYRRLESHMVYLSIILAQALVFFLGGFVASLLLGGGSAEAARFGASVLVWGVFVRTVLVWHVTWAVNSAAHVWGYQTYETGERSRNNIVVGLLSNGEGWHNNHHADPRSARHGHQWWELDVTWLTIKLFGKLGLAWKIAEPNLRPGGALVPPPATAAE